ELKIKEYESENNIEDDFFSLDDLEKSINNGIINEYLECQNCCNEFKHVKMFALNCCHFFCNECWIQYIKMNIDKGGVDINCIYPKCTYLLNSIKFFNIRKNDPYAFKYE